MSKQKRLPIKEKVLEALKLNHKTLIGIETTAYTYQRLAGYYTCKAVAIFEDYATKVKLFVSDEAVRSNNYAKNSCDFNFIDRIRHEYYDEYDSTKDYLSPSSEEE